MFRLNYKIKMNAQTLGLAAFLTASIGTPSVSKALLSSGCYDAGAFMCSATQGLVCPGSMLMCWDSSGASGSLGGGGGTVPQTELIMVPSAFVPPEDNMPPPPPTSQPPLTPKQRCEVGYEDILQRTRTLLNNNLDCRILLSKPHPDPEFAGEPGTGYYPVTDLLEAFVSTGRMKFAVGSYSGICANAEAYYADPYINDSRYEPDTITFCQSWCDRTSYKFNPRYPDGDGWNDAKKNGIMTMLHELWHANFRMVHGDNATSAQYSAISAPIKDVCNLGPSDPVPSR